MGAGGGMGAGAEMGGACGRTGAWGEVWQDIKEIANISARIDRHVLI